MARRSNNHFGIKCHSDWRGGRVYHDDDLRGECFRKYKRVEDSYDDHSRFLAERSRYERLFKLNIKDYRLKRTTKMRLRHRSFLRLNKLIKVIEDYELYRFDSGKGTKKTSTKKQNLPVFNYQVYRTHGLIYVYAKDNDSFDQIARSMGFKAKQLMNSTRCLRTSRCRQAISYIWKRKERKGQAELRPCGTSRRVYAQYCADVRNPDQESV